MAKFGSFKYGTGVKYGYTFGEQGIAWGFEFDWNNDGLFDGTNENELVTGLLVERGRDYYLRQGSDGDIVGFERVDIGKATITLDDSTGRFDTYNESSPLYPNVTTGRLVKIQARDNNTGAVFPVFAGKIKDIRPISGSEEVIITVEDGMRELRGGNAVVAIQENIAIDDAMALLIANADYTWGYNLGNSTEVLPYWWAAGETFEQACKDLAEADLGHFFIAADGKASFKGRNTINPILFQITQADVLKEISRPQPWENHRDATRILVYPTIIIPTGDLWNLQDKPLIPAGESRTYWSTFTYNGVPVPAKTLEDPVQNTDYLMNSLQDGTGTDRSAQFTVVMTPFSNATKLVVTNTGGTPAYVILLKQQGEALAAPDVTEIRGGSGIKVFKLDNKWIQSTNTAESYSAEILDRLDKVIQFPTVQIEARADIQFWPDLFDSVRGTFDKINIESDFSVGKISHQWINRNGQAVLTKWKLEPFAGFDGGWLFPIQLGIDSEFAL